MATFPSDSVRTKNWGTEILTDADLEGQLDVIHDYVKAQLDGSTGHNHDGTSNQSKKLTSAAIGATFISGLTTVTGVSTDYLMIADASDSNAPKKALASDFTYTPTAANALSGSVIQTIQAETASTINIGNNTITYDDTIPQNSEGTEVLTVTITPNDASNKLMIRFSASGGCNQNGFASALFQDSVADALKADVQTTPDTANNKNAAIFMEHFMVAGTESAITFKARIGNRVSGDSMYINANAGGTRIYGGVSKAMLIVQEIKA